MDVYPKESTLEKYIKDFVFHNTAEKVELYLQKSILIKPVSRKGSIIIGIFWSNVLQCERNFPRYPFVYKKHYDEELQEETLSVTVDGITFTVYLTTGTFSIQGTYIYEWFTQKFRNLLNNFDVQFGENWTYQATPVQRASVCNGKEEQDDLYKTETEEYLLLENTQHQPDVTMERRLKEGEEDLVSGIGNLNVDQVLFTEAELSEELSQVTQGGLRDGLAVVYKAWKSLLNTWFATEGTQVYLCSPLLDSQRLGDIIDLFLQYRTLGDLHTFYVSHDQMSATNSLAHVQKCALAKYTDARVQTFIQYRVLRKMVTPATGTTACFIAGVRDGKAEVFVTSANFHGDYFLQRKAQMVFYATMSEEEFKKRYVEVLQAPNATTTY